MGEYGKEDIESVKVMYDVVKEGGMRLGGGGERMKENKERSVGKFEIVDGVKGIGEELMSMKKGVEGFSYEEVDEVKKDIEEG